MSASLTFAIMRRDRVVREVTVADAVFKIGSDPRCHVPIDEECAALTHAVIEVTPDSLTLIDVGTDAGTWVNGARINRCRLEVGDEIRIGGTHLTLVKCLR